MATYTVTGHPLNYADLKVPQADLDLIAATLQIKGVGQSATLTLSGGADTAVKGHGCMK